MLKPAEIERYKRQIDIPEIGEKGQEKLRNSRVLIAGCGGLGSPALFYLAAAGIGFIKIVDSDKVEPSNLNRQIIHWTSDLGKSKVESASEKLIKLNPEIVLETLKERICDENINKIASGFDVILDAMDNLETRYILNDYAVKNNIAFMHGAVSGFEGRAMTVIPGKSACLMCLYRGVIISGKPPVIGVTPGIIGCIQAMEVIKYLTGIGELLENRLLVFNGLKMSFSEIKVARDPGCPHCGREETK